MDSIALSLLEMLLEFVQHMQMGKIGITLVSHWFLPFFRSKTNDAAARRAIDFMFGW